jgi:hypothetical protein
MAKTWLGIIAAFGLMCSAATAQTLCSSYPNSLTNGTTADGSQVMANFNCAALTSGATLNSPTLTGTVTAQTISAASGNLSIGAGAGAGIVFAPNGSAGSVLTSTNQLFLNATADTTGTSPVLFVNGKGWTSNAWGAGSPPGGWTGNIMMAAASSSTYPIAGGFLVPAPSRQGINIWIADPGDTTSVYARFDYHSSGALGTITPNSTGNGVLYNTTSDERLKDWSVQQRDYRPIIKSMWVGDFAWSKGRAADFGVRAQQAYSLFPEAVHKEADNQPCSAQSHVGCWSVDYGRLAPLALWGVKDLQAQTDQQVHKINEIQTGVGSLRAEIVTLRYTVRALNDNKLLQASEIAALKTHQQAEQAKFEDLERQIITLRRETQFRTARN